jgi:TRAP-type C4-dicarboxylate transport system substrate-binding protein
MEKRTLRWVLAHEPIEIFIRAAEKFAKSIGVKTNGAISIEIMTAEEYGQKYHGMDKVDTQYRYDLIKHLQNGELEMSQMYTTTLGSMYDNDLLAIDMPYIFRDHEHVARVLDGEIGKSLRDGLEAKTNMASLAFTYSGGFRVLPASKKITSIDQLLGERVRVGSQVSKETFKALGCEAVDGILIEELGEAIGDGRIVAGESTYPRLYGTEQTVAPYKTAKAVINTEHSLFLTTILINKDIWNSFDAELQQFMLEAAHEAALEERKEALADIKKNQARLAQDGVEVVDLPQSELDLFKERTAVVYDTLADIFSDGLVAKIKNA